MNDDVRVAEVEARLERKGVNPQILYVMVLGTGESLIGETTSVPEPGTVLTIRNPKRMIRLTTPHKSGLSIDILIGDLDLLESGTIKAIPQLIYKVLDQPASSKFAILNLYNEYLERKMVNRAQEAGILLPEQAIQSPFKK